MYNESFMQEALNLALKGKYSARPNPCVGCVIVKDNQIIGKGFHKFAGDKHAEINAIEDAKSKGFDIKNSDVYVSLEPCNHFGRTPPCSKRLIAENVKNVYIATVDKNPQVAGAGIASLQNAGINVQVGILQEEADKINEDFFFAHTQKKPFIRLKMAMSLDAKTAAVDGSSKWITNSLARAEVQKLRSQSNAVLTTYKTVFEDNARLTIRDEELNLEPEIKELALSHKPTRILLDRKNKLPKNHIFFAENNYQIINESDDLEKLMFDLYKQGNISILVEAGSTLANSFINANLVNELHLFIAPKILGRNGKQAFLTEIDNINNAKHLTIISEENLQDNKYLIAKFI